MIGGSSKKTKRRIGTRTLRFILAFSVAAFVGSGVSYAKPKPPPVATLNEAVCTAISGVWTANICTLPAGTSRTVTSSFKIGQGFKLDIIGNLTIQRDATIDNSGTIMVENVDGIPIVQDMDDSSWKPGLLVFGALNNSGTITIANVVEGTEGITVSFSVDPAAPGGPSPFIIVPGTLTNSGTITIQNGDQTRGIKNLGTIANSASGAITVANVADIDTNNNVGIYNRRDGVPSPYASIINGTVTNAGSITISNSGSPADYGIYNVGLFTNSDTGKFTINEPSQGVHDAAVGLYNAGSFTSFGMFTNDRGALTETLQTWGSFNPAGTMINYGTTSATGTWYNNLVMINLGTVTNYGIMWDESAAKTMINYGTIYNYGYIDRGTDKGICIDEPSTDPNVPPGSGC